MGNLHSQVRHHAFEIVKVEKTPIPWGWMIVTGIATLIPLALGVFEGHGAIAIFGALTGYFMGLADHSGSLSHRLAVATTTAIVCWIAFCAGAYLQTSLLAFTILSAIMVYILGILGGRGAEFERLLLLAGIDNFVARYTPSVTVSTLPSISFYFFIAWLAAIGAILFTRVTVQRAAAEYKTMSQSVRHFLTDDRARHAYAFAYMWAVVVSICVVDVFEINRGYWTIITVLLMMNPARKTTLYRVAQRIIGTLLGVVAGHFLIHARVPIEAFVALAAVCAMGVPFFWKRNYWLVSFSVTIMVISFLSIAQYGHIDFAITLLRIHATLVGCLITFAITTAFALFDRRLKATPENLA